MTKRITKENLFKPPKSKTELKADTTNAAARAVVEAEAANRREKTERLRAQRLAQVEESA